MMATKIHILDENTANKIAAGEVVERPASVVKELVENAIDANSRNITIEIIDGGMTYIRVTDDGNGMSREDARLAILRHATSKIHTADDLSAINTLGFRGEALPSIAAVSKFTLLTRTAEADLACCIRVTGGTVEDVSDAGGAVGTTVQVADLFFNTPARRKFLKTSATESGYINHIVSKLALANPQISFKLTSNNRLVLATPGNGSLADTLASLYGKDIIGDLLPLEFSKDDFAVTGYIGKPTLLKSNRHWQTFIINRRVINSRMLAKAIDNAYHSLLPRTGYPLVLLHITVPPNSIDVNVHPQKSEIKFADEQRIYRAVYRAITNVLSMPAEYYRPDIITTTPVSNAAAIDKRAAIQHVTFHQPTYQPPSLWREDPVPFTAAQATIKNETNLAGIEPTDGDVSQTSPLVPLGQIDNCFIIAQGTDGLYIIDQHAAHERILYDRLSKYTDRIPSQQLLLPVLLDVDSLECNLIMENQDLFYELGFAVDLAGPNLVRVLEVPVDIAAADIQECVREILAVIQTMHEPSPAELRHACLQTAACRGAIKAGDSLNMRQMQVLLNELYTTTLPYTCPHGRPTIIKFSPQDLAKMFKRTNYGG